jgi:membrane-associated phospholipid phosphatase
LKHFPSDVVAGFLIGAAGGILWPKLHQGRLHKNLSTGIIPQKSGIAAYIKWNPE